MEYFFCVFNKKSIRVDIYLSTLFADFSRSYIQKIIDKGYVKINWKIINKNIKINYKDVVNIKLIIEKLNILPEKINLDIIYQDNNFLIVNKDAWINTHPVPWELWKTNTLVNALLYHIKDLSWIWWVERPWIVHRLDKDTSWLLMIAKNDKTMLYLQNIIKNREVWKYYIAIVNWIIKENIKIESYIWREINNRLKMSVKNYINWKLAITYVNPIKYIDNKYSIVEVKIETWRTHQIRVHLSSIWHSILWDKTYWNKNVNNEVYKKYGIDRQALHSYKLEFFYNNKQMIFIWDLKNDMKKIIWNYTLKNNIFEFF